MSYIINGKSLPKVALGSWAWGTGMNGSQMVFGTKTDKEQLRQVYNEAKHLKLNCWDTAAIYGMGNSEEILGEFASDDEIILSTKYTPSKKFDKKGMDTTLRASIERLRGKIPDIYWLHNTKNLEDNLKHLCELLKNEEIGSVGICNANLQQIIFAYDLLSQRGYQLAGVQNHYSLLYRRYEKEGLIDWCKAHEIPFFSYMTLEQGALTGRFDSKNRFPFLSRRGLAFPKRRLRKIEPLLEEMKKIGEKYNLTVAQTAMIWAISKETVPIIGVTKPYQVKELAKVLQVSLQEIDIARLDQEATKTGVEVAGGWE